MIMCLAPCIVHCNIWGGRKVPWPSLEQANAMLSTLLDSNDLQVFAMLPDVAFQGVNLGLGLSDGVRAGTQKYVERWSFLILFTGWGPDTSFYWLP